MTTPELPLIDPSASDALVADGAFESAELPWEGAPTAASREEETDAPPGLSQTRAWLTVAGFGFAWACMVWSVQHMTTAPTLWKEPSMLIKDYLFRFLLDWGVCTACFAFFSTRILAALFAVNLWVATAVISYFVNYQRSLSWLTITNQSGEGAAVAMVALEDAAPYLAVLVPLSAAILFAFRRVRHRVGRRPRLALTGLAVSAAVFFGMHFDHKPLHRLERFESADGIAHSYGFAVTWAAESYYVDYEGITEDALSLLSTPVDRLTKVVPPVEIGDRLAVVQVESLDDAVRGFVIDGREVTPRLNQWAQRGTYLRVQAPKRNGSCDSDFSLLFGARPSERMAPYRIPHFPFDRSIVNVLHDRGYHTSFYHGVNGSFFERRGAYKHMDFDRVAFREEVIDELDLKDAEWTIEDGRLFRLATEERTRNDRFFEFIITGTSHTPFRFSLEDFERSFFPDDTDRAYTYFDTISYVDEALGEYVDGLPNGTVVFVYGDHWSRVENEELGYASQIIDEFGIVPAVLFRKTAQGVEPLFDVEQGLAKSAKLRLVDVTRWLRESLDVPSPSSARKRKPNAGVLPVERADDDTLHTSAAVY